MDNWNIVDFKDIYVLFNLVQLKSNNCIIVVFVNIKICARVQELFLINIQVVKMKRYEWCNFVNIFFYIYRYIHICNNILGAIKYYKSNTACQYSKNWS